jgi:hypothetical protein
MDEHRIELQRLQGIAQSKYFLYPEHNATQRKTNGNRQIIR